MNGVRTAHEVAAQAAWRVWPRAKIGLEEMRVADGKYVASSDGSKSRLLALFRVGIPDLQDDPKMDYSAALRTTLQQQRMRGLFEGLRRAAVPFIYLLLMNETEQNETLPPVLQFDLVVGTWVDVKKGQEGGPALEQRASILSATLNVAIPTATVARLVRKELADVVRSALLPGGRPLPQSGPAAVAGSLCTFEDMSPLAERLEQAPEFYVPNVAESGTGGFLLGAVKSGGRELHDFRLQKEDLARHVTVLGSTGSGKSTTAGSIVRQVAEAALPVLVLDWHNEYGRIVSEVGGRVVAPGRDEFALNPLEVEPGADPAEHIAMICDIFSDIYHFTHPQAFMFRNALQKRLGETTANEVPTIAALVKSIEGYPLRSAYDQETKVALLRRLVPLTEGQAGKALGGPGPLKMGEFLRTVVCVELGHLRDIQSRAVFSDVLLKMVYEAKVKQKSELDHLTVVEEARNIAPARRPEDPPTVGERMISELRKFGEGMMFVAQFPSHIASEIVKNSGTKIVHRLAWPDDVELVGDSLGLNKAQREHVARLRAGDAVVGVGRLPKPILVHVKGSYAPSERRDLSFSPES